MSEQTPRGDSRGARRNASVRRDTLNPTIVVQSRAAWTTMQVGFGPVFRVWARLPSALSPPSAPLPLPLPLPLCGCGGVSPATRGGRAGGTPLSPLPSPCLAAAPPHFPFFEPPLSVATARQGARPAVKIIPHRLPLIIPAPHPPEPSVGPVTDHARRRPKKTRLAQSRARFFWLSVLRLHRIVRATFETSNSYVPQHARPLAWPLVTLLLGPVPACCTLRRLLSE